jgi:hypothetical protein
MSDRHHPAELSDTGEREAIAEEAAERAATKTAARLAEHKTPVALPLVGEETMKNQILEHEKDCREKGPVWELRRDVAGLKGWIKGVGIAIVILQLLNAYGQFTARFGPVPIPTPAHADSSKAQPILGGQP